MNAQDGERWKTEENAAVCNRVERIKEMQHPPIVVRSFARIDSTRLVRSLARLLLYRKRTTPNNAATKNIESKETPTLNAPEVFCGAGGIEAEEAGAVGVAFFSTLAFASSSTATLGTEGELGLGVGAGAGMGNP
jgi:hypothetical protein